MNKYSVISKAAMNHSINDDDYYVVHPEKKHIVKRLSSSSVRVPYGTKPKDHAAIRPHIEDANKKHGDGHTVMKGMDLKYESGYKPLQEEKEMKDYLTQAPFSFAKEIAEGFAPKQTEAQVVTESTHDDGTKKSTGNAFDFKAMIAKKREEEPKLRNHDRVKTSTGTVYKRKEDAEGADETDVKPQEKRGRGRPPGKYGSYKKRIKEALEQYAIDEERLDELSKATLSSYVKKASKEVDKANKSADKADKKYDELSGKIGMAREKRVMAAQKGKGSGRIQSDSEVRLYGKQDQARREKYAALSQAKKRSDGVSKANARLTKEDVECLDESVHAITKKIASTYNIPHADAHAIFVGGSTKTMGKSMDHICNNHGFKDDATSYKENESFFNKAGVSKKEHEHLVKASM